MVLVIYITSLQVLTCTCHIYIQNPISCEAWHMTGLRFDLFSTSDKRAGNVLVRR